MFQRIEAQIKRFAIPTCITLTSIFAVTSVWCLFWLSTRQSAMGSGEAIAQTIKEMIFEGR
jgi:hypothetical protein